MKKFLIGALAALACVVAFSGCDLLGSRLLGKKDLTDNSEKIEHTFKYTPVTGKSFVYYTSTNEFSYTDSEGSEHEHCVYQISFNVGKKSWTMYTRSKASTRNLETVANGTYNKDADVTKPGNITLSVEGEEYQTVTVEKDSDNDLYFTANVYAVHKAIGAVDAK